VSVSKTENTAAFIPTVQSSTMFVLKLRGHQALSSESVQAAILL